MWHFSDNGVLYRNRRVLRRLLFFLVLGWRLVTPAVAAELVPFQAAGGAWGYLNSATLTPVIAPQFKQALPFRRGVGEVMYPNPHARSYYDQTLYGFIRTDGLPLFAERFTDVETVQTFTDETRLPALRQVVLTDGRIGVVSLKSGKWVVPPFQHQGNRGAYIRFYSRHRILVDGRYLLVDGRRIDAPAGARITWADFKHHLLGLGKRQSDDVDLVGLADWQGKVLIAPRYIDLARLPALKRLIGTRYYGQTMADVAMLLALYVHIPPTWAGKRELLTRSGKVLHSFSIGESVSPLRGNPDIAMIDNDDDPSHLQARYISLLTGASISAAKAKAMTGNHLFHRKVSGNVRYGVKAADGKVLIAARYAHLRFINQQRLIAKDPATHLSGVIDIHGRQVIPFIYRFVDPDGAGRLSVSRKGHLFGVIDLAGKEVIAPLSTHGIHFIKGRARVYHEGLVGVISVSGKPIVPPKYKTVFNTQATGDTLAIYYEAEDVNGRWGLLDGNGKRLVPFKYGFVRVDKEAIKSGWVGVEDAQRHYQGLVNFQSGVDIPLEYHSLRVRANVILAERYKSATNRYSYQLLDFNGKPISAVYSDIDPFDAGHYFIVHKGHMAGVLSDAGALVVPLRYRRLWDRGGGFLKAETLQRGYVYVDVHGKEYAPLTAKKK